MSPPSPSSPCRTSSRPCWRQRGYSTSFSSSTRARWLKPQTRRQSRCSDDVLLAGAKLAGILIEAESGLSAVAVGIGVNCAFHPADTDFPATDLAAAGAAVTPAVLLGPLSVKMSGRLAQWNAGQGFSTIRADWLARAAGMGESVRVRLAERELVGRFESLDDAGGLALGFPDGSNRNIAAGDVFLEPSSVSAKAT